MGHKRQKPFDHARAIKARDGSKGSLARKRAPLLAGKKDNAPTLRRQAFQRCSEREGEAPAEPK